MVSAGPDEHLNSPLAQGFALIVHELATNASKYGALSRDGGRIEIGWLLTESAGAITLHFSWRERGGPAVSPPKKKSFGTILLERAVPTAGLPPSFDYNTRGFAYEIAVRIA